MKTLLITGGFGYIGSSMIRHFRNRYRIVVVDNLMYNQLPLVYPILDDVEFIHADARDSSVMAPIVETADIIFPLAAIVGAPACDKKKDAAVSTNLTAVQDLVKLAQHGQIIVFPNTNSGYGDTGGAICTEETPLNAISLYGKTKDDAERAVLGYDNAVAFRLATVFGYSPRMRLDLLVNTLVKEAVDTGTINVFDDSFMRNYIHVKDICRAFEFAVDNIDKMRGQVYNLGNDKVNMSKGELVDVIVKQLPNTRVHYKNQTDPDKRNYIVSSAKLYELGWSPSYDLDDGIIELKQFYKHGIIDTLKGHMTNV